MPYVTQRWLGGTLTNFSTVKNSIARLVDLETMKEDGTFDLLAKKEGSKREKERLRLEKFLGGIKDMKEFPQAMFVVDAGYEYNAVREAKKLGIPVIGVVDTDADPTGIDHLLPGNDDALRSIRFFVSKSVEAVEEGVNIRTDAGTEEVEAVMKTGDTVAAEILAESFKENSESEDKEQKENSKNED